MSKRKGEREAAASVPPPPLRLRVHKDAPPQDGRYEGLHRHLEALGWFREAALNLGGLGAAAQQDARAAEELGIEPVEALGVRFMRATVDGLCVMFWISGATSTVYILHSVSVPLLGRIPKSAEMIATRRCRACLELDSVRAGREGGKRRKGGER